MPMNEVSTRGRRQYPSTDADRQTVNVEDRCPPLCGIEGSCAADASVAESGGDISESIQCSEIVPKAARP